MRWRRRKADSNQELLDKVASALGHVQQTTRFLLQTNLHFNNLRAESYRNPFNNFGKKAFSQTDEDGLTFEIVRRLGLEKGTFAEFGVGDGLENNTLSLVAAKWRGFWAGNEDLAFNPNPEGHEAVNFTYMKAFITRANILEIIRVGLQSIRKEQLDLISIDLDGNDIYFVETMLGNAIAPKVFIVEYNAKFIPPIDWRIDYADDYRWEGTDYTGASFCAFHNVFKANGYFPVCCNGFSGVNAFFVRNEYRDLFPEVPDDVDRIWCPPMYFLRRLYGHPQSVRTVTNIFRDLQRD
jgi:hypothetical protein